MTVVTLNNFTGTEIESGSLRDGNYTLTALANQVNVGGTPMAANFVFGDQTTENFYRFFGDVANLDRRLDISDFGFFSLAYLTPANYNPTSTSTRTPGSTSPTSGSSACGTSRRCRELLTFRAGGRGETTTIVVYVSCGVGPAKCKLFFRLRGFDGVVLFLDHHRIRERILFGGLHDDFADDQHFLRIALHVAAIPELVEHEQADTPEHGEDDVRPGRADLVAVVFDRFLDLIGEPVRQEEQKRHAGNRVDAVGEQESRQRHRALCRP